MLYLRDTYDTLRVVEQLYDRHGPRRNPMCKGTLLFESENETLSANLSLEALGNSQRLDYRPHSVQP